MIIPPFYNIDKYMFVLGVGSIRKPFVWNDQYDDDPTAIRQ